MLRALKGPWASYNLGKVERQRAEHARTTRDHKGTTEYHKQILETSHERSGTTSKNGLPGPQGDHQGTTRKKQEKIEEKTRRNFF